MERDVLKAKTQSSWRWALGSGLATMALYVLPILNPPPSPEGYAPYAFHYNLSFLFPVAFLTLIAMLVTLFHLLRYRRRSAELGESKRRWKTAAIVGLLLPAVAEGIFAVALIGYFSLLM